MTISKLYFHKLTNAYKNDIINAITKEDVSIMITTTMTRIQCFLSVGERDCLDFVNENKCLMSNEIFLFRGGII